MDISQPKLSELKVIAVRLKYFSAITKLKRRALQDFNIFGNSNAGDVEQKIEQITNNFRSISYDEAENNDVFLDDFVKGFFERFALAVTGACGKSKGIQFLLKELNAMNSCDECAHRCGQTKCYGAIVHDNKVVTLCGDCLFEIRKSFELICKIAGRYYDFYGSGSGGKIKAKKINKSLSLVVANVKTSLGDHIIEAGAQITYSSKSSTIEVWLNPPHFDFATYSSLFSLIFHEVFVHSFTATMPLATSDSRAVKQTDALVEGWVDDLGWQVASEFLRNEGVGHQYLRDLPIDPGICQEGVSRMALGRITPPSNGTPPKELIEVIASRKLGRHIASLVWFVLLDACRRKYRDETEVGRKTEYLYRKLTLTLNQSTAIFFRRQDIIDNLIKLNDAVYELRKIPPPSLLVPHKQNKTVVEAFENYANSEDVSVFVKLVLVNPQLS